MQIHAINTTKCCLPLGGLIITLVLLLLSRSGRAQEPYSASADADVYFDVQFLPRNAVRLYPDVSDTVLTGTVGRAIDLNFDGRNDLIVNFGDCGDGGDGVYGIYAQQADGKYACVFEPDHWDSEKWSVLEDVVTIVNGTRWMDITLYNRGDVGGRPGVVPVSYLRFGGIKYQNWLLGKDPIGVAEETEFDHAGKLYRVERLLLKTGKYGPLTLRIYERDRFNQYQVQCRNIVAPDSEDLEISKVTLLTLKEHPFFLVQDRYRLFLIDLEKETISPAIRPGLGVEYGEDAISGQMNGLQFFDNDNYLLGIAVSYGVFCFNISNLDHPKELLRYSSDFSDQGQPYFFLEQKPDGSYNGIVSQSDTTKPSTHISRFYTETKKARYLFRNARLVTPEGPYADPADYEIGRPEPFLLLKEIEPAAGGAPR